MHAGGILGASHISIRAHPSPRFFPIRSILALPFRSNEQRFAFRPFQTERNKADVAAGTYRALAVAQFTGNIDDIGAAGEYVATDCSNLARIPGAVAFAAAAKQALDAGKAREGQTVHVTGGLGGVAMFGTLLARRHYGAREVTATVSAAKAQLAEELGAATRVADYRDAAAVASLEGSAHLVLDAVGHQSSVAAAKPGGALSTVVRRRPENIEKLRASGARHIHTFAVQSGKQLIRARDDQEHPPIRGLACN
ncbi:hypothetical protein IWW48_004490 [Coemansia sp. RSA 1200]|nr:hypothetical protein IWW48_004490 [Coemansia sp. RSA 1200]